MYGMLYYLLEEYIQLNDPITTQWDCRAYANLCEKNFYASIETYELLIEPSYFNTRALLIGVR